MLYSALVGSTTLVSSSRDSVVRAISQLGVAAIDPIEHGENVVLMFPSSDSSTSLLLPHSDSQRRSPSPPVPDDSAESRILTPESRRSYFLLSAFFFLVTFSFIHGFVENLLLPLLLSSVFCFLFYRLLILLATHPGELVRLLRRIVRHLPKSPLTR